MKSQQHCIEISLDVHCTNLQVIRPTHISTTAAAVEQINWFKDAFTQIRLHLINPAWLGDFLRSKLETRTFVNWDVQCAMYIQQVRPTCNGNSSQRGAIRSQISSMSYCWSCLILCNTFYPIDCWMHVHSIEPIQNQTQIQHTNTNTNTRRERCKKKIEEKN